MAVVAIFGMFPAELRSGCHNQTKLQGQYGDDHNNSSDALRVRDLVACPPGQVHPSSSRPASVQDMERLSNLLAASRRKFRAIGGESYATVRDTSLAAQYFRRRKQHR